MNKADIEDLAYQRSIIKIPVAGPGPNNTLVFIRAWLPVTNYGIVTPGGYQTFFGEDEDDTIVLRKQVFFPSLYAIDGFLHADLRSYQDNTIISITGFLSTMDIDDEDSFVIALDQVEARIDRDGRVQVSAWLAEQEGSHTDLTMAFFFSAYILTYEPQPEFSVAGRRALTADDARIVERVVFGQP
jgi:hypothetical protein